MEVIRNEINLENSLDFFENNEILQSIMKQEIKYDTIIIKGNKSVQLKTFIDCEAIGKSITTSKSYNTKLCVPYDFLVLYFTKIREIRIESTSKLELDLSELYQTNTELETITWFNDLVLYYGNREETELHKSFIEILKHCKSLKKLKFNCWIPLEASIINEIFAHINHFFLQIDEIFFDCDPTLPTWTDYQNYYWMLERIEIELIKSDKGHNKVIIKPLKIEEMKKDNGSECANHQLLFKSPSVTEYLCMNSSMKCEQCYKSCFENFPSIARLMLLRGIDEPFLSTMSKKLIHLSECNLNFTTKIETWPSFPNMTKMQITLETTDYKHFEGFVKSCSNLKSLTLIVNDGISCDDCVKILSEHLIRLEYLYIECRKSKLTAVGLDFIGNNLKNLSNLRCYSSESKDAFENVFDKLLKLETINKNHHVFNRDCVVKIKTNETDQPLRLSNRMNINDLPPETLENVFLYLNEKDQLTCRLVRTSWFQILSSSSRINRTLDLKDSYLSIRTNPVQTFLNTDFKYNRVLLNSKTHIAKDENLTEFWRTIGRDIKEICVFNRHSTFFTDAFTSGLTPDHLPKLKQLVFSTFYYFNELLSQNILEFSVILSKIKTLKFTDMMSDIQLYDKHPELVKFEMSNVEKLEVHDNNARAIIQCLVQLSLPQIRSCLIFSGSYLDFQLLFETNLNFGQLKTFFVAKKDKWDAKDFVLITKNCSNLCYLGLGLNAHNEGIDDVLKAIPDILKMMFDKLPLLCGIYFVSYDCTFCDSYPLDYRREYLEIKHSKLYWRTGMNSWTKSRRSYDVFDNFLLTLNWMYKVNK